MAKAELFKNPLLSWFFKKSATFPVNREKVGIKNHQGILKNSQGRQTPGDTSKGIGLIRKTSSADQQFEAVFTDQNKSTHYSVHNEIRLGKIDIIIGKPAYLEEYYGKTVR